MGEERFKSYYGESAQIALDRVPANRRVISVLQERNSVGEYVEVITERTDLVADDSHSVTEATPSRHTYPTKDKEVI